MCRNWGRKYPILNYLNEPCSYSNENMSDIALRAGDVHAEKYFRSFADQ